MRRRRPSSKPDASEVRSQVPGALPQRVGLIPRLIPLTDLEDGRSREV
jgi:hypothetical protein